MRSEADYFCDIPQIKLPAEMMRLAQHIIRTKSTNFDPSMLEDHYRKALLGILRKKQARRPAHPAQIKPSHQNVVHLMEALRRSIAAERPAKPQPRRRAAKSATAKGATRHRKAVT